MGPAESTPLILNAQRKISEFIKNYELCDQLCATQFNVTVSQSATLLALPQEGNLTMSEVSQAMGLATSTMTRMIDQLVEKGFVQRTADPDDRRIVRVGLTPQGQQLSASLEKEYLEFYHLIMGEIREDELESILHVFDRINQAYEKAFQIYSAG
jgi:DNA-binding MarR family transcriptional regulator